MRRGAAALAAAALLSLAGCETTEQESAKIGRRLGHQSAIAGQTRIGSLNRAVRVTQTALITASGTSAVALELTNTSARPQVAFPILIDVANAAGRTVYSNDTKGIEPSLQQLALLPAHATAWWVDNEVLASAPTRVAARIGAATATAPPSAPALATSAVSASASFPGPHVNVTVTNRSAVRQTALAIYAVILDGTRVVGAGRGVVASLGAHASAQVVISVIGSIAGHEVRITAAPTRLR